jgi:hypothetical protein
MNKHNNRTARIQEILDNELVLLFIHIDHLKNTFHIVADLLHDHPPLPHDRHWWDSVSVSKKTLLCASNPELRGGGVARVAQLVEALCYKPEGRGFDSRWNFSLI